MAFYKLQQGNSVEKKDGWPRTKPCCTYTGVDKFDEGERDFEKRIRYVQPLRYNAHQFMTAPSRPYDFINIWSSVTWSTLWKAAERFKIIKTAQEPEVRAVNIADRTIRTAVSSGVEWSRV